ncbi:hypothetical protein [Deinococcus frigens]|uniref:hypothetical protein n=1 Tax=Deinococcus frigens TaxID=249403 RepID=UPI00055462BF|nr:hypothetical protein [Deinococcus frigens]
MIGAAGLVDTLEGLGVSLTVTAEGKLSVEPASVIPSELMGLLKEQKQEVIGCIHARAGGQNKTPETPEGSASTPNPARCFSGVSPDQTPVTPGVVAGASFAPLPRPLVALVQAAKVNSLNRPGFLPSGIVPNLSEYVLTCAALYACNFDAPRQLADLWAARAAAAS